METLEFSQLIEGGTSVASVEYPEMRALVISHLAGLKSVRWRVQNLGNESEGGVGFADLVDFLFDTSGLLNDPVGALSLTLGSEDEVGVVTRLREAFNVAIDEDGLDGEVRGDDARWEQIGLAAERAYRVLTENDRLNGEGK
ncbi:hypothetical protein [Streptomyces sp. NRRL S-1824]|uniref:hypothetical protein n=1 Tax=Streptomyces sp. NRRL S-1824 TaxID=1463889 RepID=UPI00131D746B|nr:hypothetical protein [Streptomyces sp. NRRL S-1824]